MNKIDSTASQHHAKPPERNSCVNSLPAPASRSLRLSSVLQGEIPKIQFSPDVAAPSELVAALISMGHRGNA